MKKIALSLMMFGCLTLSTASFSNTFERVDLHANILKETNFVPKADWANTVQSGGTGFAEANVLKGGASGSSQLFLKDTKGFGADQLITYLGTDEQYYTAVIKNINGTVAVLKYPLETTIARPQKINNFYADPDHPNMYGYKAIVDYAVRGVSDLNKGRHILFGDSWFDHSPRHFSERLSNKLPNATVINAGIGGNTTQNLLDRFNSDVSGQQPDTVWIMAGTNDYNQYVSEEDYSKNIKTLIRKITDIGARPIIFNSSVGKPITHSLEGKQYPSPLSTKEELSNDYYEALETVFSNQMN